MYTNVSKSGNNDNTIKEKTTTANKTKKTPSSSAMPGPKMGPRPADFDEQVIRQSPTFIKWETLPIGEKLRYACRDFVKGQGDDEERLMRRIMIARRNNLRDHQTLKRARQAAVTKEPATDGASATLTTTGIGGPTTDLAEISTLTPIQQQQYQQQQLQQQIEEEPLPRKRRPSTLFSDSEVAKEMDVPAVEATRSYRAWIELPHGAEFIYNQKYIKGKDGHDWLLRKNIWRRMRYRRENKRMVERMRGIVSPPAIQTTATATSPNADQMTASQIVDETLLATTTTTSTKRKRGRPSASSKQPQPDLHTTTHTTTLADDDIDDSYQTAVEAAVAVAETYVKTQYVAHHHHHNNDVSVHNPLEATAASSAALDAAARLAAAAAVDAVVDGDTAAAAAAAIAANSNEAEDSIVII